MIDCCRTVIVNHSNAYLQILLASKMDRPFWMRWKFCTYFVRPQAANDKHPLELPQLVLPLCRKILMLGILKTYVFQHSLKHLWIIYSKSKLSFNLTHQSMMYFFLIYRNGIDMLKALKKKIKYMFL